MTDIELHVYIPRNPCREAEYTLSVDTTNATVTAELTEEETLDLADQVLGAMADASGDILGSMKRVAYTQTLLRGLLNMVKCDEQTLAIYASNKDEEFEDAHPKWVEMSMNARALHPRYARVLALLEQVGSILDTITTEVDG